MTKALRNALATTLANGSIPLERPDIRSPYYGQHVAHEARV
jgi:hypothetical protein